LVFWWAFFIKHRFTLADISIINLTWYTVIFVTSSKQKFANVAVYIDNADKAVLVLINGIKKILDTKKVHSIGQYYIPINTIGSEP